MNPMGIKRNEASLSYMHIFPSANFDVLESFVSFYYAQIGAVGHKFFILGDDKKVPEGIVNRKDIKVINQKNIHDRVVLLHLMRKTSHIILHSNSLDLISQLIILSCRALLQKVVWVSWGADLYQWKRNSSSVKNRVRNLIARSFILHLKRFVGIFPPDINYFKEKFNSRAKVYYASYIGWNNDDLIKRKFHLSSIKEKAAKGDAINILIGHRSNETLNHKFVLNSLAKFKQENIKIYIPLTYGDKEYANSIEALAIELFSEKAECIMTHVSRESYLEFLATMDIAIFHTERQIGLGNLMALFYMEKKVMMPKDSIMYSFFKSEGIPIADSNTLSSQSYADFKFDGGMEKARDYVLNNTTIQQKEMWQDLFTDLKQNNNRR